MSGLRERLLGSPEVLDGPGLARVLRRGDELLRIRAARALGRHPEERASALLIELLTDPVPGVRRAAARNLGRRGIDEGLGEAFALERSNTVLLALAEARVRCGQVTADVIADLERAILVSFETPRGERVPEEAIGLGVAELAAGLEMALSEDAPDIEEPSGLLNLAARGQLEDLETIQGSRRSAGRRGESARLLAMGHNGDPRFVDTLIVALSRMDLDPSRAFAHRRGSALSLGRIGAPTTAPSLVRALEVEALEHEGHPGAGLGVQYPVRAVILWALGELQAAPAVLASYLGDLQGSALGGFHLPAMGALWKSGELARPHLERVARGQGEAGLSARAVLARL
ncbi:MAG TPA: HEAT repeat domain-containing protein [Myxococcota bacterium]|nr:HEAT repeat domain-containing protein [Myxococcota bacterium]